MALEFALLVPLLALLMVAVLEVVGVVRDVLVVQDAADMAVRMGAVSSDDQRIRLAVLDQVPGATVVVGPAGRGPGDMVTVEVTSTTNVAGIATPVVGRAGAMVEPGIR